MRYVGHHTPNNQTPHRTSIVDVEAQRHCANLDISLQELKKGSARHACLQLF